jgi:hypothetical protein
VDEASQSLAIELRLRGGDPSAGVAMLRNLGQEPVRVWRPGNEWGDAALSFEVSGGRIVRAPQEYTANVPASTAVPVGGSFELPFDLADGSWDASRPLHELLRRGAQLVAAYEVEPTPEAAEHGVWTGRLRSEPVRLDGVG